MPLPALVLVLVAGLVHASWNLLAKRASAGADFVVLYCGLSCVLFAPLAFLQWQSLPASITGAGWLLVAASGLLHFLYALILQRGYQVADLGVVYPVARGVGPLLSFLGAIALLGEPLSATAALGLVAVTGGIVMLSKSQHASVSWAGIGYGVATGSCIALYTLVDARSVRTIGLPPLLLDYLSNLVRTILLLPVMLTRQRQLRQAARQHGKAALGVAVLSPLAYILVLYAMRMAPVSHIAPAREVSMLFAVGLGATLLGERQGARRLGGAALIAIGVALLSSAR